MEGYCTFILAPQVDKYDYHYTFTDRQNGYLIDKNFTFTKVEQVWRTRALMGKMNQGQFYLCFVRVQNTICAIEHVKLCCMKTSFIYETAIAACSPERSLLSHCSANCYTTVLDNQQRIIIFATIPFCQTSLSMCQMYPLAYAVFVCRSSLL